MISLVRQRLFNQTTNFQIARTFLTNQQLGIDRFQKIKERLSKNKDTVVKNVKTSLENNQFIYTEDLKGLAYSVDTPEDAKLLKDAIINFASASQPIRLESYKFGPVVSRALYEIDDLNSLKELFNNEKTAEYFQLRSAYNIYLSILHKKGEYEEVLNVGEKLLASIKEGELDGRDLKLDNAVIVYLAAANQISSKSVLERSRKLIHHYKENILKKSKISPSNKIRDKLRLKQVMLYHLLCVKNDALVEALEVMSEFRTPHYEFLNLKASVLARLGRFDECVQTLDKILESDDSKPKYVFTETIEIIKAELKKNPNENLSSKIEALNQDIILDAKLEETILALPNANDTRKDLNRTYDGSRPGFRSQNNRFNNRYDNNDRYDNRGQFNSNFNNNRFGNNRSQFGNRSGDYTRFNDRPNSNNNNRYNNRRFDDNFSDGSRRPFRPFQTRFRDTNQESSEII